MCEEREFVCVAIEPMDSHMYIQDDSYKMTDVIISELRRHVEKWFVQKCLILKC